MTNSFLISKINYFYKLASTKSTNSLLKELSKLETFKDRLDFAEKHFKRLSSGSARVIFVLPGEKEVLKLAKNDRGIDQNKVENKVKCEYVNKTTKSDKNGIWKISPFLDKITEKEFEKMMGFSFKDFGKAIEYGLKAISSEDTNKPKNFNEVSKSDFYKKLVQTAKKYDLMPGDLSRISSFGKLNNKPIVLDAGLTRKIYDEYYE